MIADFPSNFFGRAFLFNHHRNKRFWDNNFEAAFVGVGEIEGYVTAQLIQEDDYPSLPGELTPD